MSGIVLLIFAIVLIVTFTIVYMSIFFEFDETTFAKRLRVLTEFVRRTNSDEPTPNVLGYVSEVSQNTYIVSWFNTDNLLTYHESVHDDRIETFDFLMQTFIPAHDDIQYRVKPNANNSNEFLLTGDQGDVTMKCPQNFKFDYDQLKCTSIPPCEGKSPGYYPLNEQLVDVLIFNHHLDKEYSDDGKTHPTLYLRCLANGSHVIEECPDNYTFDASSSSCKVNELCENRPDGYILEYFPEQLLVNQFVQCINSQHVVSECSRSGQIFDRNLMTCVDAHPCAFNGAGYTYITADIGDSQFFKCLNNSESQLITCINRIRNSDNQYECSGDSRCAEFANGTGQHVYQRVDDNVEYNTGQLVCDQFEVISEINCDQTNILEDKLYMNKFKLNLQFPKEIFNGTNCVEATSTNVKFLKDFFAINNIPNHYNIDIQTSMIGMSTMISELFPFNKADENSIFAQWLIYARQLDAIGINPFTGEPIECFGDRLYDVFDASRANICNATGESVSKTLHFENGEFLNVLRSDLTGKDYDYAQNCAISYENGEEIVKNEKFVARILTNILHTDICTDLYTTIYQKYNIPSYRYTTIDPKYNYTFVKQPKNIIGYGTNTRLENATNSKNAQTLAPIFNPFATEANLEQIPPVFNPFQKTDAVWYSKPGDGDGDHWIPVPPIPPSLPNSEPEEEEEEEPIPPPALILENKDLFYACHYEIPLFKLTSCHANNFVIINALANIRQNVQYDDDCEPAKGLANVLNAYVYLGNGVGCRSIYADDVIKVVRESSPTHIYTNLQTQSNDDVKYNRWIHVKNNEYLACPEDLYNNETFTCQVENDKLYYINNMQEEMLQ
ncbi:VP91/PIF-8 [Parapoynx stagnalis nucleopolyhedrovirus]|uniref:VP91/PIF-8 n=1 Tax=Parapoynx stagnalis nucleopolyhedrovirus TaxID=2993413 RepID=A0A9E8BWI0_9ABAC|nr:VP91/PIF-8 [Parapoynx stagnalis nucleopolyhedrovirus]